MSEMDDKLGAILNNPQMMQTIISMAQSLGKESPASQEDPPQAPEFPEVDISMLQKLGGIAGQAGIDPQQQALLRALSPFLSQSRVHKLERAMRAARIARFASTFLNSGGLQLLSGR